MKKADLQQIGDLIDQKLDEKLEPIKKDIKGLAKQSDLLATQKEVHEIKNNLHELTEYVVPALGNIFKWTDDIHSAITGKKSSRTSTEN